MVRKALIFIALVVAPLITFCLAPTARGQGDFVFRGGLESLTFTSENSAVLRLKVAGFDAEVRVPESARIRSASGQALTLLELAVGSPLEVTADWIDGAFTASVITAPEDEQVGAVGIIDLLLPERLVISGTEFLLDENSAPLAGQLTSGQMAAVLGSVTWNGSLLANQIVSQEQFWIFGRINKKDDAAKTITIMSRDIAIVENTKILGADKSVLTFSGLAMGARVSVTGKTSAGKLTADEVRVVEINNRVEIRGQVISFTAGSITIKSLDTPFVIFRDAKTEVVGTITPGTTVSISAILQPDATLLAQRIVSKAGTGDGQPGETGFVGILEKVDAATRTLTVQGITVRLANSAVIRSGEKKIPIAELKTGDKVKVAGTKQTDGSFLATRVVVVGTPPTTTTNNVFDGSIEKIAIDGRSIVVNGITVLISDKTVIQSGDKAIKVTDLKLGDKVKVAGTKQADGSFLATRVDVVGTPPTTTTNNVFDGSIEKIAIDGRSIVVNGITVLISDKTVIQSGDKAIKVADLKLGDKVKVAGTKQTDGSYAATQIVVIPATPAPVDTAFEGTIEKIAADGTSLVVGSITVLLSEKTIFQSGGKAITVKDLKVGDKVKVKGQKLADGRYAATLIYVLSPTTTK